MNDAQDDRGSTPVGPSLAAIMGAIVLIQAVAWGSGVRGGGLAEAVERGAARVEVRSAGEVAEADIRRVIDDQRDTLRFWATLAAVGDFVFEPLAPALRAILAASSFSAVAALRGRPIRFDPALRGAVTAQWFWVLGMAVHVALMVAVGLPGAETSATLLLPPGSYPAGAWIALRQVDLFVILGWMAVARSGWRLGLVGLGSASLTCGVLWALESMLRLGAALTCGAAMRAVLMPG
jgi:hypothetical protein